MTRIALVVALASAAVSCAGRRPQPAAPVANQADATAPPADSVARVQSQTQSGGVLELTGDHEIAMTDAEAKMTIHCGRDRFAITQAGEEVIGRDSYDDGRVVEVRAWLVHYQCSGP